MTAAAALLAAVPRWVWEVLAAAALIGGFVLTIDHKIDAAREQGRTEQATTDKLAVTATAAAAATIQHTIVTSTAANSAVISKGTDDALVLKNVDLAQRYDALRLRWAQANANPGRPGQSGAAAVSADGAPYDLTTCAARGWVDFETAATLAQAADAATAADDAKLDWYEQQLAAWPKPEAPKSAAPQ